MNFLVHRIPNKIVRIFYVLAALPIAVIAEVRLPAIFGDNMVIQTGQRVPVWGWADPHETVRVRFAGKRGQAVADAAGRWRVELSPIETQGPHKLIVSGSGSRVVCENVLCGLVWLCSGQSNMHWPLRRTIGGAGAIAAAADAGMRLFKVAPNASVSLLEDVEGEWVVCSPETAAGFSAVGYYFGREIRRSANAPVGLIQSSWGGTRAEAWTEASFLEGDEAFADFMEPYRRFFEGTEAAIEKRRATWEAWMQAGQSYADPGNRGYFKGWAEPEFDDSEWGTMEQPEAWERQGYPLDGAFWFRKQVAISDMWRGRDLVLSLGRIDDYDVTYFNGWQVGATGSETQGANSVFRSYQVPHEYVRPEGRNVVAVRIFDRSVWGGFRGGADDLHLAQSVDPDAGLVSLAGEWKFAVEYEFEQPEPGTYSLLPSNLVGPGYRHAPANLYNAMIAPLVTYALSGTIWYQGESNADRAVQYRKLFPKMIESWRAAWGKKTLPFYFVQLANYMKPQVEPVEGGWADIREAQAMALRLPDTGMAVTIDIGDADDIHPRDKQTVGKRLGAIARRHLYGEAIAYSGPVFREMRISGGKAEVVFDFSDGGLKTLDGDPPSGFAIRATEGPWHWAEAEIAGDTVLLWNDAVVEPAAVRYGWANNPAVNLYNGAGLPAVPFRTD